MIKTNNLIISIFILSFVVFLILNYGGEVFDNYNKYLFLMLVNFIIIIIGDIKYDINPYKTIVIIIIAQLLYIILDIYVNNKIAPLIGIGLSILLLTNLLLVILYNILKKY